MAARARGRRAQADLIVKASGVGVFDAVLEAGVLALRRAGAIWWPSGTSTRRRRSSGSRGDPRRPVPPRWSRATTSCFTYGGGDPVVARLPAPGRAPAASRSTTRSTPTRTIRWRRSRASRPTWASSATACPIARRGSRSSSSAPRARLPQRALPARRRRLGRQARCRPTSATSAMSAPPTTTPSTAPPRAVLNVNRASMAALRLLARRRACSRPPAPEPASSPTPGKASSSSSSRASEILVAARRRTRSPARGGARRPPRARDRRRRRAARVLARAHLRAPRGRRSRRVLRRAASPGGGGAHEARRPRPRDHLVLGQRPRDHLPRPRCARLRRARPRGAVPRARRALVRGAPRPAEPGLLHDAPLRAVSTSCSARYPESSPRPTRSSSARTSPRASRSADWVPATARGRDGVLRHRHAGHAGQARARRHEYLTPELIPRFDLYLSFTGGPTLAPARAAARRAAGARRSTARSTRAHYRPRPCRALGPRLPRHLQRRPPAGARAAAARAGAAARRAALRRRRPAVSRRPIALARQRRAASSTCRPPSTRPSTPRSASRSTSPAPTWSRPAGRPSVRLFEAAACGVPIISDGWPGLDSCSGRTRRSCWPRRRGRAAHLRDMPEARRLRDRRAAARAARARRRTPPRARAARARDAPARGARRPRAGRQLGDRRLEPAAEEVDHAQERRPLDAGHRRRGLHRLASVRRAARPRLRGDLPRQPPDRHAPPTSTHLPANPRFSFVEARRHRAVAALAVAPTASSTSPAPPRRRSTSATRSTR